MQEYSRTIEKPDNWDDMKPAEQAQYVKSKQNIEQYLKEQEAQEFLRDPNLINNIHAILSKDHLDDHAEKVTVFLVAISGFLQNHKDHMSVALKGDSSSGKDNLIDTVIKHIPRATKFTASTPAALRDTVSEYDIIAFSEMNAGREGGANAHLVEKLKQLAEGGINDILKDKQGGKWMNVTVSSPQKTTVYSTTETTADEELSTRYIIVYVAGDAAKNKRIVKDTLKKAAQPYKPLYATDSPIFNAINLLDHSLSVIIPYASELLDIIEDFFRGFKKERIKRDSKRLLALVKAYAWLHQQQREIREIDGRRYVIASPHDFEDVLTITASFFRSTYEDFDPRAKETLETIKELQGTHPEEIKDAGFPDYTDWCLKNKVQDALGLTRQGLAKRISALNELGLVSTHWEHGHNRSLIKVLATAPATRVQLLTTVTSGCGLFASENTVLSLKRIREKQQRSSNKPSFLIFSDESYRLLVASNSDSHLCKHRNDKDGCLFCEAERGA